MGVQFLEKLNKREYAIMQEAFMVGRIYSKEGEMEGIVEIQEKLESNCLHIAKLYGGENGNRNYRYKRTRGY